MVTRSVVCPSSFVFVLSCVLEVESSVLVEVEPSVGNDSAVVVVGSALEDTVDALEPGLSRLSIVSSLLEPVDIGVGAVDDVVVEDGPASSGAPVD